MADEREDGRLSRLRFRHVEKATDAFEAMSEAQLEEDTARWVDLAHSGGQLALAVAEGDLGGLTDQARDLVRSLLDVEEAQARLLKSIDENVKLLRDGPFNTGRLYLREAERLVDSQERSARFVERAQEQFYEAHALATEPLDQAAVEVHIALTAVLLGQPDDARHWLKQAYSRAVGKAYELAEQTGNTKVMKGRGIGQAATAYLTLGASAALLAVKKVKRTRSDKRARAGLRAVLPLVSCIASLHAATGGDPAELPALELVERGNDRYDLIEVVEEHPSST